MDEERKRRLTPIHELSDLDLSFILSQLSSVSGEISEKTLEELLREAESQPPSLSWCLPKSSNDNKKPNAELKEPLAEPLLVPCTNVFKNAIDTLSEISAMVKEKISTDDKPNSPKLKIKKPNSNLKYKTNRATLLRKTINQPKVVAVHFTNLNCKKSLSNKHILKNKVDKKSNQTSVSMLNMKDKSSPSKNLIRHNTRNVIATSPKKMEVMTERTSGTVGDAGSSTCRISVRSHNTLNRHEENCSGSQTLRSKMHSTRSSNSQFQSCSSRCLQEKSSSSESSPPTLSNPGIQNLEAQFESLRLEYESQFKKLNEKCERLEKFESEWKAKKGEITETFRNIPTCRDFGVQVEIQNNLQEPDLMAKEKNLAEEKENVSKNILNKFPKINFEFDDLSLDSQFEPWHNTKNITPIPKLVINNKTKNMKNDKSCNLHTSNADSRQLLSTVRSLQSEVDVLKKQNQRLKNQISSSNNQKSLRNRVPIKRTSSTQTASTYSECSNFDLSQEVTNRAVENKLLKDRIKGLENEIKTLQEKRQMDLTLLQRKHEEEIDNLLEQKMNLSKRLDAVMLWNTFEGIKGPGRF